MGIVRLNVGPRNDHERAIARIVDRLSIEGKLYPTGIEDVITVLDFGITLSEGDFLVNYIRWRMDNPVAQ